MADPGMGAETQIDTLANQLVRHAPRHAFRASCSCVRRFGQAILGGRPPPKRNEPSGTAPPFATSEEAPALRNPERTHICALGAQVLPERGKPWCMQWRSREGADLRENVEHHLAMWWSHRCADMRPSSEITWLAISEAVPPRCRRAESKEQTATRTRASATCGWMRASRATGKSQAATNARAQIRGTRAHTHTCTYTWKHTCCSERMDFCQRFEHAFGAPVGTLAVTPNPTALRSLAENAILDARCSWTTQGVGSDLGEQPEQIQVPTNHGTQRGTESPAAAASRHTTTGAREGPRGGAPAGRNPRGYDGGRRGHGGATGAAHKRQGGTAGKAEAAGRGLQGNPGPILRHLPTSCRGRTPRQT